MRDDPGEIVRVLDERKHTVDNGGRDLADGSSAAEPTSRHRGQDVTLDSSRKRMFDDEEMKLASLVQPSLRNPSRPAPVLSIVESLDPLMAIGDPEAVVQWGNKATTEPVIPFLPVLVEALVVPRALAKHGRQSRFLPPISSLVARLSRLLLDEDARPATNILRRLYAAAGSLAPVCATVIEPAARSLGDLWLADDCTQSDMTMALFRLQTIVRQMTSDATPSAIGLPVVLVAPQPGEGHLLSASLDAELLWRAGWDTHREFPATDEALQALVSETWFDVLDLSLSAAMQRIDSLPLMAETISGARAASRNPALTVVVGGRAFFEHDERTASVGADAGMTSALHVVLTATAAHQATLTKVAERSLLVTSA